MSERSAAIALRESFGDRKLPDISRKITACVTCRKLKIKCHMTQSKPPCTRCKAHNTPCVVNKSLQTLLEADATWKEDMEQRLARLEQALSGSEQPAEVRIQQSPNVAKTPIRQAHYSPGGHRINVELDLSCSLGAFPAASITSLSQGVDGIETPSWPDIISRGIISVKQAKQHLGFFQQYLDPLICQPLGPVPTVAALRARSTLLTAAVCTVAAFCTDSDEYPACLSGLQEEVFRKLFAQSNSFDDVLALCVGAFWLRGIAGTLQGLAVRIGYQLDLHRCITKMPHTDVACYNRTRIYFLTFLCDHHCSLVYGKPSMTHEWRSLKNPATLLQSEYSTPADLFLICQIELWSINRRVFETFGADIHSPAASRNVVEINRLDGAYSTWYNNWKTALSVEQDAVDTELQHILVDFYYHSGRLFLFSHVFRGQASTPSTARSNQDAFDCALSVIRCFTLWQGASQWIHKLPSYFSTMIAFACVCLVRASFQAEQHGGMSPDQARNEIKRLVTLFRAIEGQSQPLASFADTLESAVGSQQPVKTDFDAPGFNIDMAADFDWDNFWSESMNSDLLGNEMTWMFPLNDGL
ncbi:hypothetical protein M409DRAFT_20730 [Zasmidium cellare ATCC 36951]|uniref:Zn(2)-C6 fungal-type domain-containing protein n=1 Tax=Zasmidium cellare ATCC 36951 TaxID=1080233 RepID=A0A6A6CPW5_ZASCE|nr:uncharacterized protein M409DRAFT_20730 [Zasmidium cellare ATCC 36951]KAF2168713.1 hypothetical protein M409DRAFT_20730 [Zasmidium cellare ATCC 36951]